MSALEHAREIVRLGVEAEDPKTSHDRRQTCYYLMDRDAPKVAQAYIDLHAKLAELQLDLATAQHDRAVMEKLHAEADDKVAQQAEKLQRIANEWRAYQNATDSGVEDWHIENLDKLLAEFASAGEGK